MQSAEAERSMLATEYERAQQAVAQTARDLVAAKALVAELQLQQEVEWPPTSSRADLLLLRKHLPGPQPLPQPLLSPLMPLPGPYPCPNPKCHAQYSCR